MKVRVLNNLRIIDPLSSLDVMGSILIEDGYIKEINPENLNFEQVKERLQSESEPEIYNFNGQIAAPGFIDMHVHLREPGFEHKETIKTGTKAAVKGGFTAVCAMPNTNPPADTASTIKYIKEKAVESGDCYVFPIGCITKERKGEEIAEYGELECEGVVGLSDDGNTVLNSQVMRRSLEYASGFDLPLLLHCEDDDLAGEGQVNEGYYGTILGLEGIPAEAEEVIISRDIKLAELTGSKIHICHVSTKGGIELIREAKEKGIFVTAEACPHHFSLTHEDILSFDPSTKVNPPLRSSEDVKSLLEGLKDNTIDVIATDHAPHARHEKEVEYNYAPYGISGLETALPVTFTFLYNTGFLSLEDLIRKFTINPAGVIGIEPPKLQVGCAANITIVDLNMSKEVDVKEFASKGKNTPFKGRVLDGWPVMTIVDGEVKFIQEEVKLN